MILYKRGTMSFAVACAVALSGCSLSYEEYSQQRDYCEENGLKVDSVEGWNPNSVFKVYCVDSQGNKFPAHASSGG